MKKITKTLILSMILISAIAAIFSTPTYAKSKDYTISGYAGGMAFKQKKLKVAYNGNVIKVSGYGKKTGPSIKNARTRKLTPKSYKVDSSCKVGSGGYVQSYKHFLKEEGRKGRIYYFVDLKIKNNKVVYIDYGL